jgi:hypothetical protein
MRSTSLARAKVCEAAKLNQGSSSLLEGKKNLFKENLNLTLISATNSKNAFAPESKKFTHVCKTKCLKPAFC